MTSNSRAVLESMAQNDRNPDARVEGINQLSRDSSWLVLQNIAQFDSSAKVRAAANKKLSG